MPLSLHELPAPFRRRCPARSPWSFGGRSWPGIPCRRSFGSQSANRATEAKSLHKQTGKTLPSREASSSVLCSDSICSKTAPIALNALRIEPKYLCDLFSIFNCLVSISWVCMGCQQLFTAAKQFRHDAIKRIGNFSKTPNMTKYRGERRG